MRRRFLFGLIGLAVILIALWLSFAPTPLPFIHTWLRFPSRFAFFTTDPTDLDGDGNDDLICYDSPPRFLKGSAVRTKSWWLTMRKGRLIISPIPLQEPRVKGRYVVGKTDQGVIAVAELTPDGRWKVQPLCGDTLAYNIGDLDGDGESNDAVMMVGKGSGTGKLVWFKRQPNGRWKQVSEFALPLPSARSVGLFVELGKVTITWLTSSTSHPKLMHWQAIFWDGRWRLKTHADREGIRLGDWDGDGRNDLLRFQWRPSTNRFTLHLLCDKPPHSVKQEWHFPRWQLVGTCVTDELGDERNHLLLILHDRLQQMRLVDYFYTPPSRWRCQEIARWKASFVPDAFVNWGFGDADGDGDSDLVLSLMQMQPPPRECGVWLLQRSKSGWSVRKVSFGKERLGRHRIGKRIWFSKSIQQTRRVGPTWSYMRPHLATELFTEIGTFRTDRRWQSEVRMKGSLVTWEDLDGDGFPEFLVRNPTGMEPIEPAWLWRRTSDGKWQGFELPVPTKWRRIAIGIYQEIFTNWSLGSYFGEAKVVRWEGKKWFLLIWHDGVVQAVTVNQP